MGTNTQTQLELPQGKTEEILPQGIGTIRAADQAHSIMSQPHGQQPATDYGKSAHLSHRFPTANDLLGQIDRDLDKESLLIVRDSLRHPSNMLPENPDSEQGQLRQVETIRARLHDEIAHLSSDDLQTIGELAQNIKAGRFENLQKIVDRYKDNPAGLAKLDTALNCELEREYSQYRVAVRQDMTNDQVTNAALTVVGPPQPDRSSPLGAFLNRIYNTADGPKS